VNHGIATSWKDAAPYAEGFAGRSRAALRHMVLSVRGQLARFGDEPFLRGLYCHYVFDDQVIRFRRLMEDLQSVGRFVDTETCFAMLRGDCSIDGRFFHLSFDDGFKNVRTNAAPVLRELGIPAIAFVPSAVVGAQGEELRRYCLEVTRYRGVIEMMSWEDVRDLPEFGIEVGSHTRTHARLSLVSKEGGHLWEEIAGSREEIEAQTGRECRYISWPYGEAGDVDFASIKMIREAGYDGCFSAVRGSVIPGKSDDMRVPRHHFEVQWPTSHARYFLSRP